MPFYHLLFILHHSTTDRTSFGICNVNSVNDNNKSYCFLEYRLFLCIKHNNNLIFILLIVYFFIFLYIVNFLAKILL